MLTVEGRSVRIALSSLPVGLVVFLTMMTEELSALIGRTREYGADVEVPS